MYVYIYIYVCGPSHYIRILGCCGVIEGLILNGFSIPTALISCQGLHAGITPCAFSFPQQACAQTAGKGENIYFLSGNGCSTPLAPESHAPWLLILLLCVSGGSSLQNLPASSRNYSAYYIGCGIDQSFVYSTVWQPRNLASAMRVFKKHWRSWGATGQAIIHKGSLRMM